MKIIQHLHQGAKFPKAQKSQYLVLTEVCLGERYGSFFKCTVILKYKSHLLKAKYTLFSLKKNYHTSHLNRV
jgi:hypothetical protein